MITMSQERPIVLISNADLHYKKLEPIADLIINPDPAGATREWVMENIEKATVFFFSCSLQNRRRVVGSRSATSICNCKNYLSAKKLKYLVTISVGTENIDVEECRKRGIRVGFAGHDILTEATAEHCVALTLAIARRIPEAANSIKAGGWKNWSLSYMNGKGLKNSIIGFYGMGRIGESVAEKLLPFRPRKIIYHNRNKKTNVPNYEYVSFEELVTQSDFLLITTSANADNVDKFDRKVFEQMKTDSILVNISRGKVVHTNDLMDALLVGQIGSAALDVTEPEPLPEDHPLFGCVNCLITPHIASGNVQTRQKQHEMGEENVYQALLGNKMPSRLV
ncbi:Glyoxylate reductase/hydroxypyruvate reductase [Aphelenchoides besseyi]|nr:Glyoxylate reductase/hydroxypyruvate reductase [Aphelenchoides besseyi]